jgi:hypothetical protein
MFRCTLLIEARIIGKERRNKKPDRDEKSMKVVKSHEGKVHHYVGDRNKKESYLKAFKLVKERLGGQPLTLVVDYCAYDKDAIEVSLACLKESLTSCGCYVYISTGKYVKS